MADVSWIKLYTDIFNNRKIRQIESLPDGDAIVVIWLKLLCLAGDVNDSGMVYFTKEIPYTDEMLSTQFNRPLQTIRMALKVFEDFRMIEIIDNILQISNWEKYQNVDGMEKIREQTRKRVEKHREKQKLLACNVTSNVTVTECNATDIDRDKDIDKEKDITISKDIVCQTDVQRCVAEWNNLSDCGIKPVSKLTAGTKRYDGLKARIKQYGVDEVLKAINMIRNSDFLQGKTGRDFVITFDWFVKPNNFPKVLEGNYANGSSKSSGSSFDLSHIKNSSNYRQNYNSDVEVF